LAAKMLRTVSKKSRVGRGTIVAFAACLWLAACQSLVPTTPPDTYDLTAPETFPDLRGATRAQFLILEPSALSALDRQEIVVKPSDTEILYLDKAQWSDRLPKLVQARLIESFENTDRASAVARPGDGLIIDYQIVSSLRAFQANISSGVKEARVALSAKIVSDRTGKVVRTRIFEKAVVLPSTSNNDIVLALDAAFDALARDIVSWTLSAI
jgi:cholesterol transport system auxiliary component